MNNTPRWLEWAREIQALAQTGLRYSENEYNSERYRRLMGIAAEIIDGYSALVKSDVLESFEMQYGYATPKVDVRGAVVRGGKILLVQERSDQRWCMPGGWADVGTPPSENVVREVWEESGFRVEARKVIGIFDANQTGDTSTLQLYHAFKIVFLCELTSGEAHPSNETQDVGFFEFDRLPPLSIHRTNERHLAEVAAHLKDPHRPTAFD